MESSYLTIISEIMESFSFEVFIFFIALYGALLSTVLALIEGRKDRGLIRVTCNMALTPDLEDIREFIEINAANVGRKPIHVTSAGLFMSNGCQFLQLKSTAGPLPLPKILCKGDSVSISLDFKEAEKALGTQKPGVFFTSAYVRDMIGNEYKSGLPRVMKDRKLAK